MNEVTVFAVNRQKEFWARKLKHLLELRARRVSRGVDIMHGFVQDGGTLLEQIIDHASNGFFIAGNKLGTHEYQVSFLQLNLRMLAISHSD